MATKPKSTEVAVKDENKNTLPDYLKGQKNTGMEALGSGDFKIPRIKILQPLNPEVKSFPGVAIPGEFWHTGANISLGNEFNFVVCIAKKRVILWNPRDSGGGMLAFSSDGQKWDSGGNKQFSVKLKNVKDPVIWDTKANVQASGLLNFGTSNPAADDEKLPPAATLSYEYLIYLPDHPELSPVVMSLSKTAQPVGKKFNTSLLMSPAPMQSMLVRCFADYKQQGQDEWFVPNFQMNGYVPENVFKACKEIEERNTDYKTEYEDEGVAKSPAESAEY